MKNRLLLSIILLLVILISMPFAIGFFSQATLIIYFVYAGLMFSYVLIYLFGGVVKFIIYTIYAFSIIILLYLLGDYHQPIIIIGGLLFIVNPLANFENWLDIQFDDEQTLPLRINLRGRYSPFYQYLNSMKDYYKLPQTRKLYTKKWYLRVRQLTTLFLLFLSIYLLINEMRNIVIDLTNYNLNQLLIFYTVFSLFYLTFILYKKGFTSFFRSSMFFVFFPSIYLIAISNLGVLVKSFTISSIAVGGVAYTVFEMVNSIRRVAYNSYHYYDSDLKLEVFANDFYEPLVYNETYYLVSIFKIEATIKEFHRYLDDIIIKANLRRTIITAYAFDGTYVYLYTEDYYKNTKNPVKLERYLEYLFKTKIYSNVFLDPHKEMYEKTFFHSTGYIVARAITLVDLLKDLKIEAQVVIRMLFNFKTLDSMQEMAKLYSIGRIEELDSNEGYAAFVDEIALNHEYIIETKVRDILLNSLIHQAQYVRILVFYLD